MQNKRNYILKGIFILYIIGLCFCCFWDFRSSIDLNTNLLGVLSDKAVHFMMFFPMPVIAYFSFPKIRNTKRKFTMFCISVFIFGTAIGAATELIQGWTGYRTRDLWDLAADCLGLISAIGTVMLVETFVKARRRAAR